MRFVEKFAACLDDLWPGYSLGYRLHNSSIIGQLARDKIFFVSKMSLQGPYLMGMWGFFTDKMLTTKFRLVPCLKDIRFVG